MCQSTLVAGACAVSLREASLALNAGQPIPASVVRIDFALELNMIEEMQSVLDLSVMRHAVAPMFNTMGQASSYATLYQCLVDALATADYRVVHEHLQDNPSNMISDLLVQARRSRSRQAESSPVPSN